MITYKYYHPTLDSMNRDDLTIWDHNPVISPFPVPNPSLPTAILTPPESNTATRCGEELRNRGAKPCILLCRWCWCGDYAIIWVRSDWPCCARVNRCLTVPSVVNRGDFNRSIRSPDRGMIGLSGDSGVGDLSTGVERVELLVILHFCVFHLSLFLPSSLGISFWWW